MLKKLICLGMAFAISLGLFCGCELPQYSFESHCKTSSDGFVYYEDSKIGLCIIALPDNEDVIIPEFIDNKPVKQLGYKEIRTGHMETHTVLGKDTKKLTIMHPVIVYSASFNIETLVYVDYVYIKSNSSDQTIRISNVVGNSFVGQNKDTKVKLQHSDRQFNKDGFVPIILEIPEFVTTIESGVFIGVTGVTIKTSYNEKPQGWQDGWNGTCEVVWGVEIQAIWYCHGDGNFDIKDMRKIFDQQ